MLLGGHIFLRVVFFLVCAHSTDQFLSESSFVESSQEPSLLRFSASKVPSSLWGSGSLAEDCIEEPIQSEEASYSRDPLRPGCRMFYASAFSSVDSGSFFVYGGFLQNALETPDRRRTKGDLWQLNFVNESWRFLNTDLVADQQRGYDFCGFCGEGSPFPSSRYRASMIAIDQARLLLFGGYGLSCREDPDPDECPTQVAFLGDTWVFDSVSSRWAIVDSQKHPSARSGAALWYSASSNTVFLYGWIGGGESKNDAVWHLKLNYSPLLWTPYHECRDQQDHSQFPNEDALPIALWSEQKVARGGRKPTMSLFLAKSVSGELSLRSYSILDPCWNQASLDDLCSTATASSPLRLQYLCSNSPSLETWSYVYGMDDSLDPRSLLVIDSQSPEIRRVEFVREKSPVPVAESEPESEIIPSGPQPIAEKRSDSLLGVVCLALCSLIICGIVWLHVRVVYLQSIILEMRVSMAEMNGFLALLKNRIVDMKPEHDSLVPEQSSSNDRSANGETLRLEVPARVPAEVVEEEEEEEIVHRGETKAAVDYVPQEN